MSVLDDVLRKKPWQVGARRVKPKGRRRLPENPRTVESVMKAIERVRPRPNPLVDPLAGIKRPLNALNGPRPGSCELEFHPVDVLEIRRTFHMTQPQFARLMGINVKTLRNWEQGRRRPHGPSRALLRVAAAKPNLVASVLLRYKRVWWLDW